MPKPKAPEAPVALVQQLMSAALAGVPSDPPPPGHIQWVLAADGVYQRRHTRIGRVTVRVAECRLPGLPPLAEEAVALDVAPLPWRRVDEATAFLRWARRTLGVEAVVRGAYDATRRRWTMWAPRQTVSGAAVWVAPEDGAPPAGVGEFLCEIHGHPGSCAAFSSVDDADERAQRIYGIVADLDRPRPRYVWRVGTGTSLWVPVRMAEVVDFGDAVVPLAAWLDDEEACQPEVPFPTAWRGQLHVRRPEDRPPMIIDRTAAARSRHHGGRP